MFIFCLYVSQGSSRPPLLPPIPFRIYLPPRKTKFQALRSTLHPALWFSADFFLFLFSDAARSSTVIFETSDVPLYDDKPNRAPPDPRTLPRYCPAPGTRLWREGQSVIFGTSEPPKSNRYIHFFTTGGGTAACRSVQRILQNTLQTGRP